MAGDFKALTVVSLPFAGKDGKTFQPGQSISQADFDKNADGAEAANPDGNFLSAEEQIADLKKNGSISDDPDAELHPDHRPVDPNAPTLQGMIEQAKLMVERMGDDAPAEMKALAETKLVQTTEDGTGGEA